MDAVMPHRFALPARRRTLTLAGAAIAAMLFYAIAFPKGGIKVFGVPLTFGYAMTAIMMLIAMARAERVGASLDRLIALIPCLLLGIWSVLVVRTNGSESAGFTTAYFVSVVYLPLFGLVFFSPAILDEHNGLMERTFVWAVRFIIVYGIFLFLFRQATGRWIEVPYLTVNADDAGTLDEKYIDRGGVFKLISTYNNGNIFGVSIAMMAPLYLLLERKKALKWALYLAVVLTLSRTVWIGLMLVVALRSLSRGVRPLTVLSLLVGLTLGMVAVYGALSLIGLDLAFLFDSNLGGRATQLVVLDHVEFVPSEIVGAIPEIVYLGVLKFFGLPGLLLFIAYILVVPLLLWLEGVPLLSMSRASACMQGLLIYAVLAGADGAFNYIPVMMVFWMIAGWGFWYARRQALGGTMMPGRFVPSRAMSGAPVPGSLRAAAR